MPGKRYYWLRLQKDFFDSKRIKKLRKLAGGDTYTIIYLKMQLLSLESDGILRWSGLEDDFASELALDLDEKPENVAVTLQYLLSCGLAETEDNINFFLPWVEKNTGSEDAGTQRVRDYRARQKALQCNADVTQVKRIGNVEKESEKELEIEREKDNISFLEEEKQEKEEAATDTSDRQERIEHFAKLADSFAQHGWDTDGPYRLAANDGISPSEIDAKREVWKKP